MALQTQNIPVNFAQGPDTKTDPKKVIPGKLLALENATFQTWQKFAKCFGAQVLQTLTAPYLLTTFKNELVAFGGGTLKSYSPNSGTLVQKGVITPINLSTQNVVMPSQQCAGQDVSYDPTTKYVISIYVQNTVANPYNLYVIKYSVVDSVSGTMIISDGTVFTATVGTIPAPKVILFQGQWVISFFDGTDSHIKFVTINPSTPSAISAMTRVDQVFAMSATLTNFDCTVVNNRIVWFYYVSNGTGYVRAFNSDFSLGDAQSISGSMGGPVGIFGDSSNRIWVFYSNQTASQCSIAQISADYLTVNFNVTVDNGATTPNNPIKNVTGIWDGSQAYLFWERCPNSSASGFGQNKGLQYYSFIKKTTVSGSGTVGGLSLLSSSVGLASKPFLYNSTVYLFTAYGADVTVQMTSGFNLANYWSTQQCYFLIDAVVGTILCRFNQQLAGGISAYPRLSEVVSPSAGVFYFAYLSLNRNTYLTAGAASAFPTFGVALGTFSFVNLPHATKADIGNNLHVSGGVVRMYDGNKWVEHGFHIATENQAIQAVASGAGGSLAQGTYLYNLVYAWIDQQGQTHRSNVGSITVTTPAATSSVLLFIPYLNLTDKTNYSIEIYRTQVNQSIPYLLSTINVTSLSLQTTPYQYTDVASDAQLVATNPPFVYAFSGEVGNIPIPPTNVLAIGKQRIFGLPIEQPLSFWYTKKLVQSASGGVSAPLEFSNLLVGSISPVGGALTAIAQMDEKIIFFKRENAFYMLGDGPALNGTNNDFSDPQLIAGAKGCINPISVILIPNGLMYQSSAGIFLLGRGLETSYIGADVEAYNAQTITSAVLVPGTTFVRFSLSSGIALVYDWVTNQWSVFTNINAQDAVIFQNLYTYSNASSGQICQETPNSYINFDGSYIVQKVKTAWLQVAGLQGFQRAYFVQILGDWYSKHSLKIDVAYDFDPTIRQTYTADMTNPLVPYQLQLFFQQQQCEAIQLTIQDVAPASPADYGHGMDLSGLTFQVGVQKGPYRLPASQKLG